ncbi:unnamed protein product [Tetraodon nigroviridis]|uniref:(spotted green pufferfish) hypothetical protein n=1 Tax=Tetraodon nigroviridis TaxID=99883 RepID=Q4SKG6_TETNG|nr:unnamed protein product [Tetraodon nigroviridis]
MEVLDHLGELNTALRGAEGCSSGAHGRGPHPHPGQGGVRADAATAEGPLRRHDAVHRSLQARVSP